MTIDVTYLSGKVKKTPPSQVSSDRYQWIKPGDVEPDLGVPLLDNSVAASLTDGTRKWLTFSNGLTISNNNVSVDETTVPIDTTDFIYSQSDTLAEVLADFDKNIANSVGGTLVSVSTDTTLTGSGTTTSPLSVVKWATPIALSLAGDLVGQVSFDGSGNVTLTANVESVGTIQAGSLDLSSPTTVTAQAGRLWYDSATGSLNFGMGGGNITQQIGEELFIYGKASAAISEGQVVAKTGAVGNSGVITFAPAPIGTTDSSIIIGVATENIALGAFGRITRLGVVNKLNTTGTLYGETWAEGDILYYNRNVVGGLTKVKPVAPNQKTVIGTVINVHANSGSIQVDLSRGSSLGGTDSNVEITDVADKDVLTYNSASNRWENKPQGSITGQDSNNVDITGGKINGTTIGSTVPSSGSFTTLSHSGVVPTEGTAIDQVKSITKSLTLTTDWQDVGITGTDLATGSYIIQLFANDSSAGGTNINEYYTGSMSWYNGATTSDNELPTDEIVLHRAGGGGDGALYLRTYRTNGGVLKLQIYSNQPNTSSSNYVFKFRRLI